MRSQLRRGLHLFCPEVDSTYNIAMKTIQITVDESLLAKVDADEETKRDGRSAVFRRAVAEYLKRRRRASIAEQYRKAYKGAAGLRSEFEGWEDEGVWPSE